MLAVSVTNSFYVVVGFQLSRKTFALRLLVEEIETEMLHFHFVSFLDFSCLVDEFSDSSSRLLPSEKWCIARWIVSHE